MERGSLNKKAPFKMKGYSYPGKSPIKQTNYFKTDLFTNPYDKYKDMTNDELMDPYLKNRKDAMEQGKYLSADGTYDYASDPKYYNYQKGLDSFSTVEETNAMTEKNIAKKKKKKEQQERSKRFKKHNTALGPTIIG